MIIFPDIEIQNGRSTNRIRGRDDDPEIYEIQPLDAAKAFVAAGAKWLHVMDIDGSLRREQTNHELIGEIIDAVDIPVQVGGGVHTASDVDWWLERGAARVVLGTAAILDRSFVMEVCTRHPGKIVISIVGKDGFAMVDGWRTKTSFTTLTLAKSFEDTGAAAIIYTDLDRFENGLDYDLAATIELGTELSIPLISTGTVYTLDDVSNLALLPNIEGTIIGRALFEGTVDLAEAIKIGIESRVAPELAELGVAPKLEEIFGIPINGITHVGVGTSDLKRSIEFYEMLGFAQEDDTGVKQYDSVVMRHGSGVAINLLSKTDSIKNRLPISLEVSSLTKTRAFLEYNDVDVSDSYKDNIHQVVCVKDPDNNVIELNRVI
ncbi:MAG: phosphoribosylformimino-5-aminoimidazole carboxamide ribotide isomerase [Arenicella sp.]|jgi:phosphoribosylformimino-5-aminoimidazole carboxamide ribotide isomerase